MRKRLLGGRGLDLLPANVNESTTGLQQVENLGGHQLALHPVERLSERRVPKPAQARRQFLRPQPEPPCVSHILHRGRPDRLVDHASVGVHTDNLSEQASKPQRHRAGAAAHVDQTGRPVQVSLGGECIAQSRRGRNPGPAVEPPAATEQAPIPRPPPRPPPPPLSSTPSPHAQAPPTGPPP